MTIFSSMLSLLSSIHSNGWILVRLPVSDGVDFFVGLVALNKKVDALFALGSAFSADRTLYPTGDPD